MKWLEKYAYRILQKKATMVDRRIEIPGSESIRRVCVLWQPEQKEAFQYLQDYFWGERVIFRNLCIYSENIEVSSGTNVIMPKDLNWLGLPRKGAANSFLHTEYDLLLNIALKQTLVLNFLTALSRARFKIGWSREAPNFFDLNINIGPREDALYLAKQQIFYLGQFNKKAL